MRKIPTLDEVMRSFGEKLMLDFGSQRYHCLWPNHPCKKGIDQPRCQTEELLGVFGRSIAKIVHSVEKRLAVLMEKVNTCPLVNAAVCNHGPARLRIIVLPKQRFLWNAIRITMHHYQQHRMLFVDLCIASRQLECLDLIF